MSTHADEGLAVIVEPRNHPAMVFVLWSVFQSIPASWNVHWFHGKSMNTQGVLMNPCLRPFQSRIVLHSLTVDNFSLTNYNQLLVSRGFWENLPAEHILVFQTDSGFMFQSPHRLQEFLEYDYVGAPWPQTCKKKWAGLVGNGGFSLRRRSAMLRVIKHLSYTNCNEDVFFAYLGRQHIKIAPNGIARRFALECKLDNSPHPWAMGFHKCWRNSNPKTWESEYVRKLQ